jgi:ubiquitin C-terminal hydrolase
MLSLFYRPKFLLLHLKRFLVVEKRDSPPPSSSDENQPPNSPSRLAPVRYVFRKDRTRVKIPGQLTLEPFHTEHKDDVAGTPNGTDMQTSELKDYSLRSIVHHIGSRASSGHYTADAARPNIVEQGKTAGSEEESKEKESWVTFDDDRSYRTSLEKITKSKKKPETAYMLLYALDSAGSKDKETI